MQRVGGRQSLIEIYSPPGLDEGLLVGVRAREARLGLAAFSGEARQPRRRLRGAGGKLGPEPVEFPHATVGFNEATGLRVRGHEALQGREQQALFLGSLRRQRAQDLHGLLAGQHRVVRAIGQPVLDRRGIECLTEPVGQLGMLPDQRPEAVQAGPARQGRVLPDVLLQVGVQGTHRASSS